MGGGGESEGKAQSTQQSDAKTAEQKKWLKEALAVYGPQLGQNQNIWQGQRVTPFSELQEKSISGAGQFADYFATPQQAGTPLFQETGGAIQDLLSGSAGASPFTEQGVQDYFKATIKDPTMASLRDDVLPSIDESFAGPGFFGSARSHARQDAAENTRDLLTQQWAGLNWNVTQQNQALEEAKANRMQAAVPQGMAFGQVPAQEIKNNLAIAATQIGGLNSLFKIGQADQTQQQAELEAEIMRFAEENSITDPENLNILLTLLGMNFSTSRGQSSSSSSSYNFSVA